MEIFVPVPYFVHLFGGLLRKQFEKNSVKAGIFNHSKLSQSHSQFDLIDCLKVGSNLKKIFIFQAEERMLATTTVTTDARVLSTTIQPVGSVYPVSVTELTYTVGSDLTIASSAVPDSSEDLNELDEKLPAWIPEWFKDLEGLSVGQFEVKIDLFYVLFGGLVGSMLCLLRAGFVGLIKIWCRNRKARVTERVTDEGDIMLTGLPPLVV